MAYIELTQGYRAQVDDEDLDFLSRYPWHAIVDKSQRAKRYIRAYTNIAKTDTTPRTKITMHALLWQHLHGDVPQGYEIDHVDAGLYGGLDNRRSNLRAVPRWINNLNRAKLAKPTTSVFKGVTWVRGCWEARFRTRAGKQVRLLRTSDEMEAARAYDLATVNMCGDERVRLNFNADGIAYLAQLYSGDLPGWFERISR